MKVRFKTNLGQRDARNLGLDHAECVVDAEVTVDESVADRLVKKGIAEAIEKPKTIKAVPPKSVASSFEKPFTDTPELKE